ncbi:MAG: AraC family transcriptional regulator [Polyangiaceae bacterium]|nr:AraC family transcriptional regulator [Polyangiaceae bacterium]
MSPEQVDPLAEVVALLAPGAPHTKLVTARGPWRVRRSAPDQLFYCVVLDGSLRLSAAGHDPIILEKGDFALVPSSSDFVASSVVPPPKRAPDTMPMALPGGEYRQGLPGGEPDVRMLIGYGVVQSPDASLLLSLLPRLLRVRGHERLATLVRLATDEARERRPARAEILSRLLEVILIEALRSSAGTGASPGLVRGLSDERLAVAIRRMHERPTHPWTVAELAKKSGLSRSTFFERFNRTVGVAPMEYLLGWRMALAKDLLRKSTVTVAEVADRVGYGSASTFSVTFTRHVGMPPAQYARSHAAAG